MKKIFTVFLLVFTISNYAQIRGTVKDDKGNEISRASVLIENTYNGTSTNEKGQYELNIKTKGTYTLVFQFLGYKSQRKTITIETFPYELNVSLVEEKMSLSEVVINKKDNLANGIIRKAIANKKENSAGTGRFKADFYSRGMFKIKDLPKKIMGIEVGDLDGALDSTRSGIIYLSETVSKITFEKPNNLKERIIASKVSGRDNGYSYNTAISSGYDFYDNTINFGIKMISPIANNAFNYYKFKLEGTFQDENNQMINKIKVIARRDAEPVFEGYIYIVDDSWAIYAIDLDVKGYRMKQEFVDVMNMKQNFSYNKNTKIWAKTSQSRDFTAGAFGIKFNGKFTYIYSNYEFQEAFAKKTFTNEIVSFDENSNKKNVEYWNANRPIPLTKEEGRDYVRKDSIFKLRTSQVYLDSIDKKHNKFKLLDVITGYSYDNSFKKINFSYDGLISIGSGSFNTVQGYNLYTGFNYSSFKNFEDKGIYTRISTKLNYGFSDQRARVTGIFFHQFNNQNYANINISGGTKVNQFNSAEPISSFINSISTLFFKDNYMKLYNKEFAAINYGQNVANGIYVNGQLEYQQRKPLFNTTDYTIVKKNYDYLSNNPLNPASDLLPAFEQHRLAKFGISTRINFGNKYISRPDGKINLRSQKYPTINLSYENAFAASDKNLNFQTISTRVFYEVTADNKGTFAINLKAGKFFNADNISFIDYKHFNGNQTHIGSSSRYLNVFNLLPYYTSSTNDAYVENHFEFCDNGFLINKVPLLNLLKTNMILGFHALAVPKFSPYTEFSVGLNDLGYGKFKVFRLDYVRAYQNGYRGDGFVLGIKFLNILE
jgi:hypothetical protein